MCGYPLKIIKGATNENLKAFPLVGGLGRNRLWLLFFSFFEGKAVHGNYWGDYDG